ncbi:hypothetical protein MSAN_01512700 [Mycena sanguinolenta]|uniref:Protein kinase domain-containing protein n=1 Tax=Mycena sanguinolenta TaxID=230812 RepID=A0A8H6Y6D1_9AGAR|nr:hypothetical protein MSAN_01512700 [Mycena sanguinolenta]
MDPQADSDEEFVVLSTSDYTESPSYARAQAGGLESNAKLFVKSIGSLPSLLGARVTEFQASGTARTDTRKYSETRPGRDTVEQLVNNYYNYHITGGFGGSGGEGRDQGGEGGIGQGPNVYFGQPQERELSGDINLIKEFKEMCSSPQSSLVGRQIPGASVRRVYTAKVEGRESDHMTVAIYQGDGAEETWNQHLANYESIRHPNIVQLYGLEATNYIYSVMGSPMETSAWIRPSKGELCLDLAQGGPETSSEQLSWWRFDLLRLENVTVDAPDSEAIIISSLSEDQYHKLCSQPSIAQEHWFQVSAGHPVGPGIFLTDSQYGSCVRITERLQILPEELHWDNYAGGTPVCVDYVRFSLRITDKRSIPDGYLFVCPARDFRTNNKAHANLYQWPACPAYWSLDPSGADHLSTEDARNLGFPAIHIETIMRGWSWDRSVYEGLRRFHEGKGFDPDGGEVSKQLGYPLYEVSSDRTPFPACEVKYPWCDLEDSELELCRELGHFL